MRAKDTNLCIQTTLNNISSKCESIMLRRLNISIHEKKGILNSGKTHNLKTPWIDGKKH